MSGLFQRAPAAPLAERMRPASLQDVVGQQGQVGPQAPLGRAWQSGKPVSAVLWGPPGCGKTTIARLLAKNTPHAFVSLSAVLDGVKQLREALDAATRRQEDAGQGTVLFVDEIHRWNKAQQDALLPHVESGLITLLGATTENPIAELTPALRSRVRLVPLQALEEADVHALLSRALGHPDGVPPADAARVHPSALDRLALRSAGDARRALSELEAALAGLAPDEPLDDRSVERILSKRDLLHDRDGRAHYDVLSALIKSLRGSDPQAAVYYLARLLAGGEDPVSVGRRLIVFASEDIGNAEPQALTLAVSATQGAQLVGMPEARIVLGQAVTYLATCPKSNAAYQAIGLALADVEAHGALPVPPHIDNAAVGYVNPHAQPDAFADQPYLPTALRGRQYYLPGPFGHEKALRERLAWWAKRKREG